MLLDADTENFRQDVRTFIRESLPDDVRAIAAQERMDIPKEAQRQWHRTLQTRGWGCPGWPKSHGGPGWSDLQLYLFEREIALADAPRPMVYGVGMLGPTIMAYGSDQQQRELLPAIRNADTFWCQGFSEPGAGSDLAGLSCRAGRQGDCYIINGSKLWTSEAHIADRLFGLFRTDSHGKKQHGITFLLLDMSAAGIEVRPLRTFDGSGPEINQVFFTDVEVNVDQRLGEEHQGWGIAKHLLSLERFGTAEVSRSIRTLERVRAFAAGVRRDNRSLLEAPEFATQLARLEIELRAVELTEYRMLLGEQPAGAEASLLKLEGTEVQNRILSLLHDVLGPYALIDGARDDGEMELPSAAPPEARFAARAHFNFRKSRIYSGSNEIQRNIIAKAVLGL